MNEVFDLFVNKWCVGSCQAPPVHESEALKKKSMLLVKSRNPTHAETSMLCHSEAILRHMWSGTNKLRCWNSHSVLVFFLVLQSQTQNMYKSAQQIDLDSWFWGLSRTGPSFKETRIGRKLENTTCSVDGGWFQGAVSPCHQILLLFYLDYTRENRLEGLQADVFKFCL